MYIMLSETSIQLQLNITRTKVQVKQIPRHILHPIQPSMHIEKKKVITLAIKSVNEKTVCKALHYVTRSMS